MYEELAPPKDIEVKFYRFSCPLLNTTNTPLSGLYNPIDNVESESYPLNNKFQNFDISSSQSPNIENLLTINSSFGKLFINEVLEGLLTLANISDHEVSLKDLKITIKTDDKVDPENKEKDKNLELSYLTKPEKIPPNKGYIVKIKTLLKYASKYTIEVNYHTKSPKYDQYYYKLKQKSLIREKGDRYIVEGGVVEYFNKKNLYFDSNSPFQISAIFYNKEVNSCLIEINIYNPTFYPLTIYELFMVPKEKVEKKIQIFKNVNRLNNILNNTKSLMLQSEEQINLLFKIDDPDIFYNTKKYILNIYWMKDFDFIPKLFEYEFDNKLDTYNEYYTMTITEKPKEDIIICQNFKVVINIASKNVKNKYIISLSQEPIKDKDKTNDREIEIIDIIEKKMELNAKIPSNNFILICKSDILGNVYLPKLKFSLYEGDNNNTIEHVFKDLLSFNCISQNK